VSGADPQGEYDDNGAAVDAGAGEEFSPRTAFLDWLTEHLAAVEVVRGKRTPWCDKGWPHPEAVNRLVALWKARLQADANMTENLEADSLVAHPLGPTRGHPPRQNPRPLPRLRPPSRTPHPNERRAGPGVRNELVTVSV
jgi:hypothetical protein